MAHFNHYYFIEFVFSVAVLLFDVAKRVLVSTVMIDDGSYGWQFGRQLGRGYGRNWVGRWQ